MRPVRKLAVLVCLLAISGPARAQHEIVPLWPGIPPGSASWSHDEIRYAAKPLPAMPPAMMIRNVVTPTLTLYRPAGGKVSGTAVIICPGGAFRILDWDNEGTILAEWLAARGVTALVLKYRLVATPAPADEFDRAMIALGDARIPRAPKRLIDIFGDEASAEGRRLAAEDARQAIRSVRRRAREWGIEPSRIGILGFSAGAFAAIDAAMERDAESRPDFAAAIYGGETRGRAVPADAPPLFAAVAQDDELGLAGIVRELYSDWSAAGVSAELHVFARGGHGFGMARQVLPADRWPVLFRDWLASLGLMRADHDVETRLTKDR